MINEDDLSQFLLDYPLMAIRPSKGRQTLIKGELEFIAKAEGYPEISDSFHLKMFIPDDFPRKVPVITEIKNKIPRDGQFHINPDDTLCLGSPLKLLLSIACTKTLVGFTEDCLIPYLYAVSKKIKDGKPFYMGELEHGTDGIVDDYKSILGVDNKEAVISFLKLLGIRKRIANKKECPCGSKKRLGKCECRLKLNPIRKITHRSWFTIHSKDPGVGI